MRRPIARTAGLAMAIMLPAGCATTVGPEAEYLVSQPQWEWQSSCCGFAGDTRGPTSEGYRYVLQFDRAGRVRAIRNDTLLVETSFRVTVSQPTYGDQLIRVDYDLELPHGPAIPGTTSHLMVTLPGGGLLLRHPQCADCYGDWMFLPSLAQD